MFTHSEYFVVKVKDGNHVMQKLVNMVDGVEQSFSCWRVGNVFFDDFHAHVADFESISLHWVSYCGLKTQNE